MCACVHACVCACVCVYVRVLTCACGLGPCQESGEAEVTACEWVGPWGTCPAGGGRAGPSGGGLEAGWLGGGLGRHMSRWPLFTGQTQRLGTWEPKFCLGPRPSSVVPPLALPTPPSSQGQPGQCPLAPEVTEAGPILGAALMGGPASAPRGHSGRDGDPTLKGSPSRQAAASPVLGAPGSWQAGPQDDRHPPQQLLSPALPPAWAPSHLHHLSQQVPPLLRLSF